MMKVFHSQEALDAEHPFHTLGPTHGFSDFRRSVIVRGNIVGELIYTPEKGEIMHCLDADEGEG